MGDTFETSFTSVLFRTAKNKIVKAGVWVSMKEK